MIETRARLLCRRILCQFASDLRPASQIRMRPDQGQLLLGIGIVHAIRHELGEPRHIVDRRIEFRYLLCDPRRMFIDSAKARDECLSVH